MSVPLPITVSDAKITIRASPPRVFEALLNPQDLAAWWAPDAVVEAELDGRYETTPQEGRQEGLIVGLEAPRRLTFTWPIRVHETEVETTVTYELIPRGPETVLHVFHRARVLVPQDRTVNWERALQALKVHLEGGALAAPGGTA